MILMNIVTVINNLLHILLLITIIHLVFTVTGVVPIIFTHEIEVIAFFKHWFLIVVRQAVIL